MKSVICFFLLGLISCTVGPDFKKPASPQIGQYAHGHEPTQTVAGDGIAQSFIAGAKVPLEWWKLFHPTKLDPVISRVLSGNLSLKAALANLRQSQDNLRAGYGVFYPQVSVGFNVAHQKSNPAAIGGQFPSRIFDLLTLSGTISYALDIFGGQRRTVEGLGAQVDYQKYLILGSYLTLTGNALNAIVARAAYQAQVDATNEILKILREQVEITQSQVKAGTSSYFGLLSLQGQMSAIEATLPILYQKINQAENLLALLSGKSPVEWERPEVFHLFDLILPSRLPKTLPSRLVRRRPDILAAEAQLHFASAQVGVATAAMFPSVTLSGTFGKSQSSLSGFSSLDNNFWSLGAGVTAPIFKGGTLSANRDAAKEAYQSSLYTYRQTTLSAFAQVADTLRALESDALAMKSQSEALKSSEEALKLLQVDYKAGTANYLQVLVAATQYQQIKLNYIQGMAQRFQDTIALFVTLGGGWEEEGKATE